MSKSGSSSSGPWPEGQRALMRKPAMSQVVKRIKGTVCEVELLQDIGIENASRRLATQKDSQND